MRALPHRSARSARFAVTQASTATLVLILALVTPQHAGPPDARDGAAASGVGPAPVALAHAPAGTTKAHAPTQPVWRVTGLGDSVTAGTRCDCEDFVLRYATLTRKHTGARVVAHNLGVPGATSNDLLLLLGQPSVARTVAGSDIVLITIGANDLGGNLADWQQDRCPIACFEATMSTIQSNIAAIVDRIQQLRRGQATEILVTDYWNVFADGAPAIRLGQTYQSLSDQVTRRANTAICGGAVGAGASCVDLYAPFKGDGTTDPTPLLADDGDHPDARGHQVIAQALAAHGWAGVTRS